MTANGKGAARWEWRSRRRVQQGGKDSWVTNGTLNNERCGTPGKKHRFKDPAEAGRRPPNQQAQNRSLALPAHYGGRGRWARSRTDANRDGVMAGQRTENKGVRRTAFQSGFYLRYLIERLGFYE